jgi:putative transposase
MEVKRSYKFRLYPNKEIENKMLKTLEICRQTYNQLLSINQETYLMAGKGLTKYDMSNCINYGVNADINQVYSQVLQNTSDRIAKAYINFFKRVKEKKAGKKIKVGYPRYKKQYKSFTYPQGGFWLDGKKLKLSKIGIINVKIGKNQNRPNGIIKTLTIKREPTGKWFAIFSCIEQIEQKERVNDKKIGMDVGLEYFLTLSNGEKIENPKFYAENEKRLKMMQRRLSKKTRGKGKYNHKRTIYGMDKINP